MDFSSALPTFVITLREGVEAALVVGIVLAYLKKSHHKGLQPWVYGGVIAGILASGLVGIIFSWVIQRLGTTNQQYAPVIEPLMEGVFNLMAIALLSWMLIWMTRNAQQMKQELEVAIGSAMKQERGAGWGIFALVFFAVLREGFETVLFIAGNFSQGLIPTLGAIAGIIAATWIGVLIFKWGIRLNLRRFFTVMGVLLLLIIAGLLVTALARFDTAAIALAHTDRHSESVCFYYQRFAKPMDRDCILGPMIWNTSKILPAEHFPGILLSAFFGYTDRLYLVQAISYCIFLTTVGGIYFQGIKGKK
ncbi:FTR1 family iron permease [Cylindrospermum sp. FACHB-282]|uniref:FTR1 family iron permease n=1 Tax=Cylindrospermum sp. FACHB-282 TaxID=2692794 RepID=UPI001683D53D|nr:FTR1 family protein [Cylindrospermum sp. FACHB-282]MBD2388373.1 FTR1 family iron permease [Cylindrospermum sp. FACHB-282]